MQQRKKHSEFPTAPSCLDEGQTDGMHEGCGVECTLPNSSSSYATETLSHLATIICVAVISQPDFYGATQIKECSEMTNQYRIQQLISRLSQSIYILASLFLSQFTVLVWIFKALDHISLGFLLQ